MSKKQYLDMPIGRMGSFEIQILLRNPLSFN